MLLVFFCFSIESSHFLAVIFPCGILQNVLRFLGPYAQNLLPKIYTKNRLYTSRLVWQIDQRCLGLPGGFRGWPIQWNHAKCCGPTLVVMATKFGLGAEIQSPTGLFYSNFTVTVNSNPKKNDQF